jgi:Icc protein
MLKGHFTFAQISDSHIGFSKAANPNVTATLRNQCAARGAGVHPAYRRPQPEFDTLEQCLKSVRADRIFYVPGEHDVLNDKKAKHRERYAKETKGDGWYSFDYKGVHFIGLVSVMNLKAGGLSSFGQEQLEWLKRDVRQLKRSVPIVAFVLCIRNGGGELTMGRRPFRI